MPILAPEEIKAIDSNAMELLESVFGDIDNLKLPVNLNSVLDSCGLSLKEGDFEDDNIAAALDRDSKTIFVSSNDGIKKKSFSIAHELGHYKMHQDVKTDVFFRNQATHLLDPEENHRETEANWFAASLLMPEKLVKELWDALKDVDKMSNIFAVSHTAMRFRLKHFKLLK